jgi:hypothetical protein
MGIDVIVESEPPLKMAELNHPRREGQEPGAKRRPAGDGRNPPGTNGGLFGLSGAERRALATGWLVALAIVTLVTIFNVLTRVHDYPESGVPGPLIAEGSSALVSMVVIALPAAIALWLRRRSPPWWLAAPVVVLGAAIYPVLHVSAFVVLRKLAFAGLLGVHYQFGRVFGEFFYEAAKDVPAYALSLVAFWLALRWLAPLWAPAGPADLPAWFDIRDGGRLVRAPIGEILAVRSAGNYAEFLLSDGRRPLMRTSLGGLEARLTPLGFLRTHRSWLVNSARVTGLRPEGSGDYAVELGVVEAPLSRRFREALTVLRP